LYLSRLIRIWTVHMETIRYVPPKHQLIFNGLHGVIYQKIVLFITTAVTTSNPIDMNFIFTIA
jgi:hypothetical protein